MLDRICINATGQIGKAVISIGLLLCWSISHAAEKVLVPKIDGDWWQVAGNPDVGKYTTDQQQPVDFAVWQAADGTWQLWSCIRGTAYPGNTRFFYRWEGAALTDKNWKPMGIAMTSEPSLGETEGGLQAPYVIRYKSDYFMFYGTWTHIALAKSGDGKSFQRQLTTDGKVGMFFEGDLNAGTRDPMVLPIGNLFYLYYTAQQAGADVLLEDNRRLLDGYDVHRLGTDYVRTSTDLIHWGPSKKVAFGGAAGTNTGSAECPFVYFHKSSGYYYLFRTQRYGEEAQTSIYRSKDPTNFGIDDDRYLIGTLPVAAPEIIESGGQAYIAALLPTLNGIRIAKLKWVPKT
jgi:hypothetical protein